MSLAQFVHRMPKIELHSHLLGSMRAATCADFAAKRNVTLPVDPFTLFAHINSRPKPDPRYANTRIPVGKAEDDPSPPPYYSLLDVARWIAPMFTQAGDFERLIYEALEDAAKSSNVKRCEMFFEPTLYYEYGVKYKTIVDGLVAGVRAAEKDHKIVGRMVAGINRAQSADQARELMDDMIANPRDEVIGIGLEDFELSGPPEKFAEAYRMAKKAGLHRTAHSSEHDPSARNTVTCLDVLECERIDHGYFILEDDAVVKRCVDQGVYFTCIFTTSRRAWRPFRRKSIKAMSDAGIRICLGADDPGMFPTTLSAEYLIANRDLGWDRKKLTETCLNGVDASWMDNDEKRRWRAEFTKEIAAADAATAD